MKQEFIFLGPPASGKGTQTSRLAKELNFPHVDTGSLLRAEIKNGTEYGTLAKSFIDKGQLVPVELVADIIKNRLSAKDCENGYILDGFPRSVEQAGRLENINKEIDNGNEARFLAVYFDIDQELLIDRIIYRRSCPKCGDIYNIKFNPPKVEGVCDKCGEALTQRKDDNRETATARFETYFSETAPLIEYYKNKNLLKTIDANGDINDVWERLLEVVK
ncbi:MAG: adenylate kinase [Candidatus Gastranaerophilales bacterium]